jgi:predicted O-linked N-acetylglucosamine transferase (SPINDLY family)
VDAPEIAPLPMLHAPGPVLGSFNALPKINEHVMSLWVQLLKALPDARLVLKNRSFGDLALRSAWIERFAREGIERDRITILGHTATLHEHLECYGGIDIALDTFPYCGTTTTCEALWMGVPVVTLVGTRHAARVGLSLLNAVGLKECITQTESEYMEAVCRLAADEGRLASLREGMRRRMLDSPLCEPHRFVSNVESLYEMLLQREIPHTNANEKQ